jgi:hypothetical protein
MAAEAQQLPATGNKATSCRPFLHGDLARRAAHGEHMIAPAPVEVEGEAQ